MSELNISPFELFNQNLDKLINVYINGINTYVLNLSDTHGKYLAIIAQDKKLSNILGQVICGHLIKEIDYDKYQGKVVIIKAYY